MESNRQKKIAKVIQKDIAEILQNSATNGGLNGVIISVSKVNVTIDLSIAKVYLSVFPTDNGPKIIEGLKANTALIRHEISQRTRHQLRRTPAFLFFLDDSLDYIEKIDRSLKGLEDPIKNKKRDI